MIHGKDRIDATRKYWLSLLLCKNKWSDYLEYDDKTKNVTKVYFIWWGNSIGIEEHLD